MLFRCNVDDSVGLHDLHRCALLARFFEAQGRRVAFALNRAGVDRARAFLGEDTSVYRIPDDPDEDVARLGHLGRTHHHKILFTALPHARSAYFFGVHRLFDFTAVLDRGSRVLLYANLVINGALGAHDHPYQCHAEARLLLGPKFHICDPTPLLAPEITAEPDRLLLNLGRDMQLLVPLIRALRERLTGVRIDVLLHDAEDVAALAQAEPDTERVRGMAWGEGAFAYHRYPLILTASGDLCLDLARQGLCFLTMAMDKQYLQDAYVLDQLGVAPTLGWRGAKSPEAVAALAAELLADVPRRAQLSRIGRGLVDGQGPLRIARFVPAE